MEEKEFFLSLSRRRLGSAEPNEQQLSAKTGAGGERR